MSKYAGNIVTTGADAGYSVAFDGTGDYLSVPYTATNFGTGDFTVETWIYYSSRADYNVVLDTRASATANPFIFGLTSTNGYVYYYNGTEYASTSAAALNTWNHIAVSRSGTTIKLFLNGAEVLSRTDSTNLTGTSTGTVVIGRSIGGTGQIAGYLSNLRVVKGTALYTAAFTPPTQLFAVTNTQLLTCNSPAIIDQSSNNFAITVNGDSKVSTFSPFAGYQAYNPALGAATPGVWRLSDALQATATRQWNMYDPYFKNTTLLLHGTGGTQTNTFDASVNNFTITPSGAVTPISSTRTPFASFTNSGSTYFNGSSDYLSIADNATLEFGSSDFTIEAWVYPTVITGDERPIWGHGTNSSNWFGFYITTSGTVEFAAVSGGPAVFDVITTTTVSLNTWTHLAAVRNGTSFKIYINGVDGGGGVTSSSAIPDFSDTFKIGGPRWSGGSDYFAGYMSNVRVVKGLAVYTGNFTVPTAPLATIQTSGTNIAAITGTQTALLSLQYPNAANNNAFLDSSSNNFLITRNGNTTQGSFTPFSPSGWSVYSTGSSSYVQTPGGSLTTMIGGALSTSSVFTMECWVNAPGALDICGDQNPTANNNTFAVNITSTGAISLGYWNGSSYITLTSTGTMPLNTWGHAAWVVTGGSVYFYINGVASGSASIGNSSGSTGYLAFFGYNNGFAAGYLSNFRVSKYARYTSSFTPPTQPLVADANTTLLCFQSNRFVDSSANNFALTVTSGVSVQAFSPFNSLVSTPITYSNWFNGSTGYLTAPSGASVSGSGAWTVEFWAYMPASQTGSRIISGAANQLVITMGSDGSMSYGKNGVVDVITVAAGTSVLNTWVHIVVAKAAGGTARIWRNGSSIGTATDSQTYSAGTVYIGATAVPGNFFSGCISNLRIVNADVYGTSNTTITVPTAPLPAIANTLLLTCQSNTFKDNSANNYTISSTGVVQPVASPNPFGFGTDQSSINASYTTAVQGGSAYFDGNGDYLTWAGSTVGTGAYTFECWFYLQSFTSGPDNQACLIGPDSTTNGGLNIDITSATNINIDYYGVSADSYTVSTINLNTWNHFVAVRNVSGVTTVFLNGLRSSTGTRTDTKSYGNVKAIGRASSAVTRYFPGYIAGAKFDNAALYDPTQVAIAVPTAPKTSVASTQLLLNYTNGGIVDSTGKNVLETVGNAQISTTQSKYGGSSMYFGSTNGNYLTTYDPTYKDSVGGGDWTFECWVYVNALPASSSVPVAFYHLKNDAALATTVFVIELVNTGAVNLSTGAALISAGTAGKITTGSWIHFACVRSSGTFKTYFNGVSDISVANTTTYNGTYVQLGAWRYSTYDFSLNGYLQDVRISKYARYTSNFTPPTSLLQNQ